MTKEPPIDALVMQSPYCRFSLLHLESSIFTSVPSLWVFLVSLKPKMNSMFSRGAVTWGRAWGALLLTGVSSSLPGEPTPAPHRGRVASSYPPIFTGNRGESYKEWKRGVEFWILGEAGALPANIIGPRMMVSLQSTADLLVRHLKPEDFDGDDGKNLIYKTLESSPLVVELDHVSEDRTQKEFLKLRRTSGESMDSYTARAQL